MVLDVAASAMLVVMLLLRGAAELTSIVVFGVDAVLTAVAVVVVVRGRSTPSSTCVTPLLDTTSASIRLALLPGALTFHPCFILVNLTSPLVVDTIRPSVRVPENMTWPMNV